MRLSWLFCLFLLSQDDVAARLKAEKWRGVQYLVEKGEGSRAALQEATKGGDRDVTFYAQAALAELDSLRAGGHSTVPRTTGTQAQAARVVADLFKSAGLSFSLDSLPEKSLTLPDGLTFAEALDAVSQELNVEFVQDDKGTWKPGGPFNKVPRFSSGSVRARMEGVVGGTTWNPGLPPTRHLWLTGNLQGFFSRFRAPVLYADLRVLEALDEHGRDLRWHRDWHEDSIHAQEERRERDASFIVALKAPDLKTTRVACLRLAADFCFKKKEDRITFDKVAGARSVRTVVGDVEATLLRAGMEGDVFRVDVKVKAPGVDARIPGNEERRELGIRLLDAEGRAWERSGGGYGSDGRESTYESEFKNRAGAGPPATVTFSMITEVEVRSVYFEFRDLNLP